MTIVVDTSVLIDHLRGSQDARTALRRAAESGERLTSSVLARIEILAGMRASEETATERLFGVLDWIDVDQDVAERAGRLANRFLRSHPGVDTVDYVIAATASRVSGQLWTRNVKHFPMFPGLAAPY